MSAGVAGFAMRPKASHPMLAERAQADAGTHSEGSKTPLTNRRAWAEAGATAGRRAGFVYRGEAVSGWQLPLRELWCQPVQQQTQYDDYGNHPEHDVHPPHVSMLLVRLPWFRSCRGTAASNRTSAVGSHSGTLT